MPTTPRGDRHQGDRHDGDGRAETRHGEADNGEASRGGEDREGRGRVEQLPAHVVEDLLASERRRRMLRILAERSAPVVLDDLMRVVLAEERETIPSEISTEACAAARTEAYEVHLPKLTAVDVVRYDSLVGTLELKDDAVAQRIDQSG